MRVYASHVTPRNAKHDRVYNAASLLRPTSSLCFLYNPTLLERSLTRRALKYAYAWPSMRLSCGHVAKSQCLSALTTSVAAPCPTTTASGSSPRRCRRREEAPGLRSRRVGLAEDAGVPGVRRVEGLIVARHELLRIRDSVRRGESISCRWRPLDSLLLLPGRMRLPAGMVFMGLSVSKLSGLGDASILFSGAMPLACNASCNYPVEKM
ncbi:hypothetical protein TOPH_00245 [Tolypocladium ophioglossoides CBS 100239]|uniref:Uncharacterized protein n=1 Tax=Tolypocladium ophioglossoides (strain CBS 100239) TaxID=1163406 RepID=A0A0L0NKX2_TOLOC|nr:hypothetical protein TOPH_00245 [Tolypocladium ophioglossoides CBS 100239]